MPARSASCAVNGLPSHREGSTQASAAPSRSATSERRPSSRTGRRCARMRSASSSRSGPSPAIATSGAGCSRPSRSQARDGLEQDVVALLRVQPADGHQQRPAVVHPELVAHLVARARRRRQRRGEGRHHPDVARTEPAGVVGQVAGHGEHEVGATDRQPLDRAKQPLLRARALLEGVVQRQHERSLPLPREPAGRRGDQAGAQAVGVHEVRLGGGPAQLGDRAGVGEGRQAGGDADRPEVGPTAVKPNRVLGRGRPADAHPGPRGADGAGRSSARARPLHRRWWPAPPRSGVRAGATARSPCTSRRSGVLFGRTQCGDGPEERPARGPHHDCGCDHQHDRRGHDAHADRRQDTCPRYRVGAQCRGPRPGPRPRRARRRRPPRHPRARPRAGRPARPPGRRRPAGRARRPSRRCCAPLRAPAPGPPPEGRATGRRRPRTASSHPPTMHTVGARHSPRA